MKSSERCSAATDEQEAPVLLGTGRSAGLRSETDGFLHGRERATSSERVFITAFPCLLSVAGANLRYKRRRAREKSGFVRDTLAASTPVETITDDLGN